MTDRHTGTPTSPARGMLAARCMPGVVAGRVFTRRASARNDSRNRPYAETAFVRSAFVKTAALGAALAIAPLALAHAAPKRSPERKPAAQQHHRLQLIYSPWTKFCLKGKGAKAEKVCFTGKDARIESGQPVVSAVLIEPQGSSKKILRVTLPLGMQLIHGTRVIIDQHTPMTAPYVICFANGCIADYNATKEMIEQMKRGRGLVVQAINAAGEPISVVLPLTNFAKAYDGPPTNPKVFAAQQKKLQQELEKRAEEARKRLEAEQNAAGAVHNKR